ncbi:MAG TPA: NUDIX domain-containing protein, partial [Patescibacteria group bacterium]|nr:NUDIX domain-containing protein [Patescibacteria group bacterium]
MERYCTKCGKITTKKNDSLYVCEAGHDNWVNPATGVSAYVIRNGKVLFGVRSSEPGKGKLDVPGGFVEVHESAEQAAIRESKEEFGIDITLKSCLGTYASVYEGRPALNIVFVATMSDQPIAPADDMSGGDPVWRDIEDLPGSAEIIDDWMVTTHK